MMVCFETGRTPLEQKKRNRISSVRRVPVYHLHDNFLVKPSNYEGYPLVALRNRKGIERLTLIIAC